MRTKLKKQVIKFLGFIFRERYIYDNSYIDVKFELLDEKITAHLTYVYNVSNLKIKTKISQILTEEITLDKLIKGFTIITDNYNKINRINENSI